MNQLLRYKLCIYSSLIGILISIAPAYGNTVLSNGLTRSFGGVLVPALPSVSTISSTAEGKSSSVSIKSNTVVNEQGAGVKASAIATSPNGETSQSDVNQFTPGATSISTTVNASSSDVAPPSTQITVETPAAPIPQSAIAVDNNNALPMVDSASNLITTPAIATPPTTLPSITPGETAPAIVPVVTAPTVVTPTDQPNVIDSSNLVSTPTLTQINTPEATFTIVNPSATAPPSTTFIPAFAEASVVQNTAVNIDQGNNPSNVKIARQQTTAYETVGMPSRVWPGLGLTQRLHTSN
jgi:hypothetical protein